MIESALATKNLSNITSDSTSLFEIENDNLIAWATNKPSGDCNTMPALPLTALEEPSISSI